MSTRPCILSIDLGTGGPKVALVGADGRVVACAERAVQTLRLPGGGAEQDAEEIWSAIRDATRQVLHEAAGSDCEILGVGVDSQYSSIVPVDASGRPVMNLILWMDVRGGRYSEEIYQRHPQALLTWLDVHGAIPLPSGNDSLSHMLFVQRERPEVWERTHKFLEAMDFVAARLTGQFTSNLCTAFMLLLTDNRRLDEPRYDEALLAMSGIDRAKLPELGPVFAVLGRVRASVAEELGLPAGTRVFSPINDTQAVAVGMGTFVRGHGGLNSGTTSQVLAHVDFKRTDVENQIVSMPSAIRGRYAAMAENGLGARTVDHFLRSIAYARDGLGDHARDDPFAALEQAVRPVPAGSGGLLYLPWLTGSHSPRADANARGGFLNLSLDTTRAHMLRAVMEGVAYNLRWLLPAVEKFAEQSFDELRFAGGAALSDAWSQILADVMDRPVLQLEDARHVNNLGTAFLAFQELGEMGPADLPRICRVRRAYAPRPEHRALYDHLFAQFLATFEALQPVFAALNARPEGR